MKKQLIFAVLLTVLTAACVCGLAEETTYSGQISPMDLTQRVFGTQTGADLPADYNPAAEEYIVGEPSVAANANKVYAGATPIPIDPIDMPTATPRPELTFTFGDYTASKLGITFKSAVGYEINENINGKYILTEPAVAVKDNYPCTITLEVSGVTKNYQLVDVKNSLKQYLDNESSQYEKWEIWQPAKKTLMGGNGYYNNYRGVLADGTIVRGRVHMAMIGDNQLLTLHISCPGWYNSSYMKIYDQIHSSIKAIEK